MKSSTTQHKPAVKHYFATTDYVSAYELHHLCNVPYTTSLRIIKRYLKNGWIEKHGYFKLPTQHNKIIIYKITDRENIMKTQTDIAIELWTQIKEEKLSTNKPTETTTKTTTETTTKTTTETVMDNDHEILNNLLNDHHTKHSGDMVSVPSISSKLSENKLGGEDEMAKLIKEAQIDEKWKAIDRKVAWDKAESVCKMLDEMFELNKKS